MYKNARKRGFFARIWTETPEAKELRLFREENKAFELRDSRYELAEFEPSKSFCPVCNITISNSKFKKHLENVHKNFKVVDIYKSEPTVKPELPKPPVAKGVFSNCPDCGLTVDIGLFTLHSERYCLNKIRKSVGK